MRLSAAGFGLALALAGVLPHPALAQSAADKATAREVATQGIRLYQEGQHAAALDQLRRAQELFNAPVHLLYIARAQEKLGQLVEAAENYRTLSRYPLQAGAPEAWTQAVEDGKAELTKVEPRIPKLRIVVAPPDAKAPELTIDGASVSAAVIGIDRSVNPGTHRVTVKAPGKKPAEATVEVPEGKTTEVRLELQNGPTPPTPAADQPKEKGSGAGAKEKSFVGYMVGLRLGGAIPAGNLVHNSSLGRDVKMTDVFQGGAGVELHGGVRLGQLFTPVLYLHGGSFSPGDGPPGTQDLKNPTFSGAGLGLIFGTPPGQMGGFGELDVVANAYEVEYTQNAVGSAKSCKLKANGTGFRIGGGGVFPVASWLHLTPFATATFVRTTSINTSDGCGFADTGDVDASDVRTSTLIVLGVGGDIVLGGDRPD